MRRTFALMMTLMLAAVGMTGLAQDKPQIPDPAVLTPGKPGQTTARPATPLKVQLTLTRFVGEKKIASVPYMLGVLTQSQKTSLRMGVQVPVVVTVFGQKGDGTVPQSSYNYRDVGTNIDCQATDLGNGLFNLSITVEDSAIQMDRAEPGDKTPLRDVPAFRSFRASFAMVLRDGQTMQYASATDPVSGEVMKIDVSLSLAK